MAMDSSHTVLVHLKLSAENFEHYYHCESKKDSWYQYAKFFKLLKTMGNSDTLSLYLERDNESVLGIRIENSEKNNKPPQIIAGI